MNQWHLNPRIQYAAKQLWQDGLIAYPTEAVWGLGCNPFSEKAVMNLLALKDRPVEKGLILLAADIRQFDPFISHLDDLQRQRLKNSWPGAITWIVPANDLIPVWISGQYDTVALRVTDHPVAAGLSRAFGAPIVSTSCNPNGLPPAKNAAQVRRYFGKELSAITLGVIGKYKRPSEIRDLLTGEVRRPG